MRILQVVAAALLLVGPALAQVETKLSLVPVPSSVQTGTGQLQVDRSFSVSMTGDRDPVLDSAVKRFMKQLSAQTGILFYPKNVGGASGTLQVHTDHGSEKVLKLGEDESYTLVVEAAGAKLTAANTLGILHGLQTFLQLVQASPSGFAAPAVTIKDQPRFPWRGLLIDTGRHFIPIDVLKRNLDGMAAVKMNVLHWHIYDNEGFRIESKRFPKLQEAGSDGRFYTQDEIKDFVAYAHDRGIRVVPEFEMPGHSRSMFVGYPELASGPGPYELAPGGVDAAMDPTREETYKFIDKFIEEMTKIFPDDYVHIGGDEVNGHQWDTNPKIQTFMHEHGMKNNQDLQAYFNQRLEKILEKHHRIMMGWDEVLHPELPKKVLVQSWRGQDSLAVAARQGYRGLLSFGYYLDLMWPAARHYAVDPMSGQAASLNAEEKNRIVGGESCMWSEWATPENIDSRIWPRNAAIAERLWSPAEIQDPASMYARIEQLSWRFEGLGLKHRSALPQSLRRMAGTDDVAALRTLAAVVEPVKDYTRWDTNKGPLDFRAPLNRLVDFVQPESDEARQFRESVQTYLKSGAKDREAANQIRTLLVSWRDNDAKLHPLLQKSFLLQELAPLSADLSTLGSAGLFALDYLERSAPSPAAWRTQQIAAVEAASTAKADMLLVITEPVKQLIEASGQSVPSTTGTP